MYYLRISTEDKKIASAKPMDDDLEEDHADDLEEDDAMVGGAATSSASGASASASASASSASGAEQEEEEDDASSGDVLIYFCKNCGDTNTTPSDDDMCVLYTQISHSNPTFAHVINKYTKYDPTLPRTIMECPKSDGDAAHKDPYDVIYIRYDDINMRFVYLCTVCDTTFTTMTK